MTQDSDQDIFTASDSTDYDSSAWVIGLKQC